MTGVASSSLSTGWHHVAATFINGSVASSLLWIDGVQQTTAKAGSGNPSGTAVASAAAMVGGSALATTKFYAGRLDEVRFYTGQFVTADVTASMASSHSCAAAPGAATLLAYYKFEEATTYTGAAGQVLDSSGNNRHGTAIGTSYPTTSTTAPARAGSTGTCGYASFDGPTVLGAAMQFTGLPVSTVAGRRRASASGCIGTASKLPRSASPPGTSMPWA